MNFFSQQEHARKLTFRLVLVLIVAVTCLIVITTIVVAAFIYFLQGTVTSVSITQTYNTGFLDHILHLMFSKYFLWIALSVCSVVFCGSVYKHMSLRQGGKKIALLLGGAPINQETSDANERKLINVVEEMAIASGSPIPEIYILPEAGINAFTAGNNPQAAVIGVTKGCINNLSRDELQGVIAHEFSHIHNGDMRLNIKLIAILHGVLLIGLIGQMLLRGSFYSRGSTSLSRLNKSNNKGSATALGFALVAIGYGGTFFGNLIKASVSRQREFLADASAVQFTRNPIGIGSALHKISQHHLHSIINNVHANEFSHMYFAKGIKQSFSSLFSTHPETDLRLKRIFPNGIPSFTHPVSHKAQDNNLDAQSGKSPPDKTPDFKNVIDDNVLGIIVLESISEAGTISGDIHQSSLLTEKTVENIPDVLLEACHNAFSSRAIIFGLILDTEPNIRTRQIALLNKNAHPRTRQFFHTIEKEFFKLTHQDKMPLMELCLPSLNSLSGLQEKQFKKTLRKLIEADNTINLFEWSVYQRVMNHNQNSESPKNTLKELLTPISLLLTCVSTLTRKEVRQEAFLVGYHTIWPQELTDDNERPWELEMDIQLKDWSRSLKAVRTLRLLSRPVLLKALARVIEYDKAVTQDEITCFRLIANTLDCPIPSFTLPSSSNKK